MVPEFSHMALVYLAYSTQIRFFDGVFGRGMNGVWPVWGKQVINLKKASLFGGKYRLLI
jgi:hypothetical protein